MMLRDHHGKLAGLNAVVVGRSNIVGKRWRNCCWATVAR